MLTEEEQQVWNLLAGRTLQEQVEDSQRLGTATPALMNSFVKIANRMLSRSQFVHMAYRDEVVNGAIVAMLRAWPMIVTNKGHNLFAYFATITYNAAIVHTHNENRNRQRQIRNSFTEL